MQFQKVLMLLLDSVGVGALPDAAEYNSAGAATVPHVLQTHPDLQIPNLRKLGLCSMDGMTQFSRGETPEAVYCRCASMSRGKDSIVGHWEIMGVITERPFNVYPDGFPPEIIDEFIRRTGVGGILGNRAESGTKIIEELGEQQRKTGWPIIYTSADSVFQIAAHEEIIPVPRLYELCAIARQMFDDLHIGMGRVIARPYIGTPGQYIRTANRHDYATLPPVKTFAETLHEAGVPVHSIGKPYDIFVGRGFDDTVKTKSDADGLQRALAAAKENDGFTFCNILDFDQLWGHRRNPDGYAAGLEEVDRALPGIMDALARENGLLIITADHGCDPTYLGTDHTREYIPALLWHKDIAARNAGTQDTFANIGATVLHALGVAHPRIGKSIL
ncbi:MAG: phosphopentomutase [Oscillospiraceae bacterium]|nr:phosphopentomutase [Oscillospiraceae bacterium]